VVSGRLAVRRDDLSRSVKVVTLADASTAEQPRDRQEYECPDEGNYRLGYNTGRSMTSVREGVK